MAFRWPVQKKPDVTQTKAWNHGSVVCKNTPLSLFADLASLAIMNRCEDNSEGNVEFIRTIILRCDISQGDTRN